MFVVVVSVRLQFFLQLISVNVVVISEANLNKGNLGADGQWSCGDSGVLGYV
jgi:hypothetical protein